MSKNSDKGGKSDAKKPSRGSPAPGGPGGKPGRDSRGKPPNPGRTPSPPGFSKGKGAR